MVAIALTFAAVATLSLAWTGGQAHRPSLYDRAAEAVGKANAK